MISWDQAPVGSYCLIKALPKAGDKFGRLTVVIPPANPRDVVQCVCKCGTEKTVRFAILTYGTTKSCGCLGREHRGKGLGKWPAWNGVGKTPPEFFTWRGMLDRCYSERCDSSWENYGGRGISVCERWIKSFDAFFEDMGPKPHPSLSIDRINVNGHYEPSNCRWASWEVQANNKRTNVFVTYGGTTLTMAQWSRKLKISPSVLGSRIKKGWSAHKAFTTPVRKTTKPRDWILRKEVHFYELTFSAGVTDVEVIGRETYVRQ